MTLAIDTNVLVYAHRDEAPLHAAAVARLRAAAEGTRPVAVFWPCLYEFLRVVTHPRVFDPPSSVADAWRFVQDVLRFPTAVLLAETDRHEEVLAGVLEASGATANLVHDAHIAALMVEHGISDLLTGDRDFDRFPGIRRVPLA